jgi:predicted NUDIX family NTP pyrophosphohydrolase
MIDTKRKLKKKKKRDIYCGNCGKFGHTYKKCTEAITSLGIIVYRLIDPNKYCCDNLNDNIYNNLELNNTDSNIEYLLIQRKDSLGYVEFIRGRYKLDSEPYLINIFGQMTTNEIIRLKTLTFEKLWGDLWMTDNNKLFKNEFLSSESKFEQLKKGITMNNKLVTLELIINSVDKYWEETEWGFPKGRRNLKESDINCADREFQEESGFESGDYVILKNIEPVVELFVGTNNITYKHIYYIGKCITNKKVEIQKNNKVQIAEVKNIGWFSLNNVRKKIRPTNIEKIKAIENVHQIVINNNLDKEEFILYKSPKFKEIISNDDIDDDIVVI